MYIKRQGSALISCVIILSVMSMLGAMYYKMIKYNMQLESLNYNHNDRYDFNKDENEVIYEYMKTINTKLKGKDGEINEESLNNISLDEVGKYAMRYNIDAHDYILRYKGIEDYNKYRVVNYRTVENKITLVPSYIFAEEDMEFIKKWESGL